MTKIFLLSIFLFIVSQQKENITYTKIDNPNFVRILNDLVILNEFNTKDLSVRILEVRNESGSAGFASDEASSNIYIAVSEFDEAPDQNVFQLNPIYLPKVEKVDTIGNVPTVYLSYINNNNRIMFKIKCSLLKLNIDKMK